MPYTVTIDTKEYPPTLSRTSRGWHATRTALVAGFADPADPETLSASDKLDIALLQGEVPNVGDGYPVSTISIQCIDQHATLIEPGTVRITLTYGVEDYEMGPPAPSDQPLIEIGAVTEMVTTNQEYTDEGMQQMVLTHDKIVEDTQGQSSTVKTVKAYPEVQVPVARPYFRFSRQEPWLSGFFGLVGSVNANNWSGYPPRTWYFGSLEQRSSDGGQNYDTHYALYYNPDTWDKRIVFLDDETGQIPGDLIEGQGTRIARVRREIEWNLPEWLT